MDLFDKFKKRTKEQSKLEIYDSFAKIESPKVYTLNTICGHTSYSPHSYWLKIPREVFNRLGLRATYSDLDFEVIIIRKP